MRSTDVFSSKPRSQPSETTTITFVLLKEDRDNLKKKADEMGLSLSGLCRDALSNYLSVLNGSSSATPSPDGVSDQSYSNVYVSSR